MGFNSGFKGLMLMWSKLSPLGYRHSTSVFTIVWQMPRRYW